MKAVSVQIGIESDFTSRPDLTQKNAGWVDPLPTAGLHRSRCVSRSTGDESSQLIVEKSDLPFYNVVTSAST
jgi:hypothetical protein